MKVNPKVSIIIPVYNGAHYVGEAIDSALAQTYENIEIILVNDGSTDEGRTEEVVLSYGDSIRYFYKENGGVSTALNLGIRNMTGEWFTWLSHDDVFHPDKISIQMEHLKKEGPSAIAYSDIEYIDSHSNSLKLFSLPEIDPRDFLFLLISENFLYGCTLLIPKKAFEESGLFNEALRTTQDYEMWLRLYKAGYVFRHIPAPLVRVRLHDEQESVKRGSLMQREIEKVVMWALDSFEPGDIKGSHETVGMGYLQLALHYKKRKHLRAAAKARKLAWKNIDKGNPLQFFKELFKLIYCLIWNKAISPAVWRAGTVSFLKKRKWGNRLIDRLKSFRLRIKGI